jgi:hypothetical protein
MFTWTAIAVLAAVASVIAFTSVRRYARYRGVHVITCPENLQAAAVTVAPTGDVHLRSCSRWPEMDGCDEACLREIESSPEACSVRTIVSSWYEGKSCTFCQKPIGEIVWHERPPAVRMRDAVTREWKEIRPEQLPVVFATAQPVCWSCHVVEEFRRDRPQLVIERKHVKEPVHVIAPTTAVY